MLFMPNFWQLNIRLFWKIFFIIFMIFSPIQAQNEVKVQFSSSNNHRLKSIDHDDDLSENYVSDESRLYAKMESNFEVNSKLPAEFDIMWRKTEQFYKQGIRENNIIGSQLIFYSFWESCCQILLWFCGFRNKAENRCTNHLSLGFYYKNFHGHRYYATS